MIQRSPIDILLDELSRDVSNKAIECAARVAKIYGASPEVVAAILKLRSDEKEAAA